MKIFQRKSKEPHRNGVTLQERQLAFRMWLSKTGNMYQHIEDEVSNACLKIS